MANPTDKIQTLVSDEISPDGNPTGVIGAAPKSIQQPKPSQQQEPTKILPEKKEEPAPEKPIVEEGKKPEETQEDNVIDFDQFLDAKETDNQKISREQQQQKKSETTPAKEVQQPKQEKQLPKSRDYSDLSEEDKPLFERMSNDAFNKLKPIYTEYLKIKAQEPENTKKLAELTTQIETLKKGVTQIPDSYYSHKDAYLLTPEFSQAAEQVNDAQTIYNHWMQQLEKVREGAKDFDFVDRNPQTGQLYISKKIPADIRSETQLMTYINYAQNMLLQAQGKVQAVKETYNMRHSEASNVIKQQEEQYFNTLFDTEEKKKIYEPLVKQQLETLPPAFRNNPIATLTAKSLAMNYVLSKLLAQVSQKQQPANGNGNGKPVINKQPSAAEISGEVPEVKSNKKGEDITIDEFERVKGGY